MVDKIATLLGTRANVRILGESKLCSHIVLHTNDWYLVEVLNTADRFTEGEKLYTRKYVLTNVRDKE